MFDIRNLTRVDYQVLPAKETGLKLNGEFTVATDISGSKIDVEIEGVPCLSIDLDEPPFSQFSKDVEHGGDIGFRCAPGEEAIISYIEVTAR